MRALVTGAFGFAGRHLVSHLQASGDTVLGTLLPGEKKSIECASALLDICDREACSAVVKKFDPDVVYHLAGVAFGPDAEKNFDAALKVNVGGTFNVLSACAEGDRERKVVHISSAEVYARADGDELPITENSRTSPHHHYALSKLMGELVAQRFRFKPGLKVAIIRAFNHIGEGQRYDFVASNFAWQLSQIKKGLLPPVMRVGNLEPKRDFSHVKDIMRGYRLAALKGEGVYNLCSGRSVSIQSLLDMLIEISGLPVKVERDPERVRPAEIPEIRGSCEKARLELGWTPEITDIRSGLADSFNYWMKQGG